MDNFQRVNLDNDWSFVRGAARIMIAGRNISFPSKISDIIDTDTYDAQAGWEDLGATKSGIEITPRVIEEQITLNQETGAIEPQPLKSSCTVSTQLAEVKLEHLQLALEGSDIEQYAGEYSGTYGEGSYGEGTYGGAESEELVRTLATGTHHKRTVRRLAVLFRSPITLLIRAFIFRKVEIDGTDTSFSYNKTGDQQTIPIQFNCLPDFSVRDIKQRFFVLIEQTSHNTYTLFPGDDVFPADDLFPS